MGRNAIKNDPIELRLDAILSVVQDLLILEGAKAGIKRDDLRKIVAVDSNRISRIMKQVRRPKSGKLSNGEDE